MTVIRNHRAELPIDAMCEAVGLSRATFYRKTSPIQNHVRTTRPPSPRALSPAERIRVLEALHEPRFVDQAPADVYATLLDEGVYIASERTMYRILAEQGEVRDRRNQRQHPSYSKPRLIAKGPNEVWSWDITKLPGPRPGSFFQLYVILDIYSRFVPGWLLSHEESDALAEKLFVQTCARQNIPRDQLTVHADRGASMKSRLVAQLFVDLGVTKSHSRPRVSNDNPFSECASRTHVNTKIGMT